ncbi:hypothetical protein N658DRAFT_413985 [Parathielavia hyrcaniae]|uniref:Homeobox domain-containing protein n=1 Tax=Parathielavia hyrcaniae TaxID=113614 RepID=A0AAN6Q9J1_9PEZI|nr:hypothetical protein N658DRAFT_413985 [Parathielavia hyrcaniae]
MLHWKCDDLFVLPELEDLEKCFRDHYNFQTDIFSIPSENSHLELMLKVADMVKQHESEDTLFVVYYGGHARIDESRQSTWCANRRPGSPWLQWSAIQTLLERSASDVLILLDCCAGAASATFPTGKSITETISASSWDAIAPDPGRYSFTNALIEVLQEWRQRTFSAAMLHAEILARLKHPRPILINGKHFEARSTPVHFMMTSNHRAPSIEVCRLVPRKQRPPSPPNDLPYWGHPTQQPRLIEGRNPVEQYPRANALTPDFRIPRASEPNEDEPHVLISLALKDDQRLDLNDWETWLATFPAMAKYVKVQGVFKSHSTLLLLSLPVMVWDFLPDDPACSFVAFVRSNNLLQTQKAQVPQTSRVPVASEAPVTSQAPDDAESCFSGTTFVQAESLNMATRQTGGPALHQVPSAGSVPYGDPPPLQRAGTSASNRLDCLHQETLRPKPQPSTGSLKNLLRNVASTTSLSTLERRKLGPSTPITAAEPISRAMILNKTRSSKKSAFQFYQNVPQGQQMAAHVVGRLEAYFQRDPDPNIAVVEHLASNLGVETSDVNVWFHHRREQERMTYNLQNLRIESQSRQEQDSSACMILPGHLNSLLEIHPSKGILLVDLRSPTDFERSHIHDAINLRAPLSFVENTSLEMIEDTFMDDQSRRSFSKWSQFKCVVFYDRVIEFEWECPVADALYTRFRQKGWRGQCFILKGHYREFSASFDKHISGAKMTSEAKKHLDSLRQRSSPTVEEAVKAEKDYLEWLETFAGQHRVPSTDLIPARKLERRRAVDQHQRELEVEFEARFPALYRKAQALAPVPGFEEAPSPPPGSPPPPFHEPHRSQSFRKADRTRPGKVVDDDDEFEMTKAPLVGPLVSGLEKMREASGFPRSSPRLDSGTPAQDYHDDYPMKARMDYYADEYDHDYDEIDPKSEGLRNDPVFQKAGAAGSAEPGAGAGSAEPGAGAGTGTKPQERGGEDTVKKAAKKIPFLERLRGGGK